ncbi:MAG: SMP-30/gluconolactonase/LRE family protein [Cyclobacteriaceae bacterium]|nr:SMP-30/gluconolactonase/LRE family protein [Cyclobacteriaceae bacterium]
MRIMILFSIFILASTRCSSQNYISKDLTVENLFSENIEGPNIDKQGRLFVVNYQKNGTIGLVHKDGRVDLWVTLPEGSIGNSIMFDQKGNFLIADFKAHNILSIDPKTKIISIHAHNDQFNQPNDMCINKKDQLFVSDPNWKESTGKIWRIDSNGKMTLLTDQMGTTNGIELSPDEKVLYVNESIQRKLWAFDIDSDSIKNKRLLFEFPDFGLDGMKCDEKGNLFVTRYGKGVIAVISPTGKLLREIPLKGKSVSNLIFGGKDGKTCYVTLQDRKCVETFRSEAAGRNYKK